jgi:hypothetical protein
MKLKNQIEKFVIFILVICSTINITSNILPNITSIRNVNGATNPFIADYSFDSSPTNNLYLVYREKLQEKNKLQFISADSDYQWNITAETIIQENSSYIIESKPSLQAGTNKLWFAYSYVLGIDKGIILCSRNYTERNWITQIVLENQFFSYLNPEIMLDHTNETLWLSWKDKHETTTNLYCMIYNITSNTWSNNYTINSVNGLDCTKYECILDESGNAHFIWSQGNQPSLKINFRTVLYNGTMSGIDILTDGTTNCVNPTLIIDSNNYVNAFWENQTVENPGEEYGTVNIRSSRKPVFNGSWSNSIEVAPYVPIDRPPTAGADAMDPIAAIDLTGDIWLAYMIREHYAYRQGIDLRSRDYLGWNPSVQLSVINNLATKPHIQCDQAGNLHCLWLDLRTGNYVIYYRMKYANNLMSDEVLLTKLPGQSSELIKLVLIIVGIIVVLTVPSVLLSIYIRKRQERLIKKKMELLK